VAELARNRGIETLEDPQENLLERIETLAPDFIFSFYYRRMLPPQLLATARRGAFNMHGSLLPKYRGRAPVNWAVLMGEAETGATLHEMVAKPDAGRIVDRERVPIGEDETAVEVFRKVTAAAETVLRRSLPHLLAGDAVLKEQDLASGSYFGGRRPEDGRIDWSKSAREIHNLVRAVAPPYPGAFSNEMRITRTRIEAQRRPPAGKLGPYQENGEWFAACGDGRVLRLLEVQPLP
jgi:methionyl-tRNA formyltransferase